MKEPLLNDKQPVSHQDNKQQAVYDWFERPLGRSLQAIEVDRLRARPVTTMCIACKEEQERRERQYLS